MGIREPSSGRILLGEVDTSTWETRAPEAGRLSPRTGTVMGCCSRRPSGRTPHPRPPDRAGLRLRARGLADQHAGAARHGETEEVVKQYDVRTPRST